MKLQTLYLNYFLRFQHVGQTGNEKVPFKNNFLTLIWNIKKLYYRIELDFPKNAMTFVFRFSYILAGKWRMNVGAKKLNTS
jgi:hypothetical protein